MKECFNKELFYLFIFILLIQSTSALSLNMKEEYRGLETAIVKIEGNIIDLIKNNQVEFKINNEIMPFNYDVKIIYENYYIWFVTPRINNDTVYTLILKGVAVQEFGENKIVEIQKNFTVKKNVSEYYIIPGFISSRENYELNIYSNLEIKKKINLDFPLKKELEILPGKNTFVFDITGIDKSIFRMANIGTYSLPIYIIKEGEVKEIINDSISITPVGIFKVEEINKQQKSYTFKVVNVGENLVNEIYLDYDDKKIKITPDKKINLEAGEQIIYNITLEKEQNISEIIKIISKKNNITEEFIFYVNFTNYIDRINYTLLNETLENNSSGNFYCQEIGGRVCLEGQECEGQKISTLGNISCCIGKCSLIKSSESDSSWIGYLIVSLAIISIVFAFIRYKKIKPSKTVLEKTIEQNKAKSKAIP